MTVWIDRPAWPRHGTTFAHLASDAGVADLHAVARRARLHPRSFDGDHYDVPAERWADAVAAGAQATSARDLMLALRASGWRLRKRHGDRGVARLRNVRVLGSLGDVDLVSSARAHLNPDFVACQLTDSEGRLASVWAPGRGEWSLPGGHIEPGESPRSAILRELGEETGLDSDSVEDLVEVGYWRFSSSAAVVALQLFSAHTPTARPRLRPETTAVPEPEWLTWEQFRDRFVSSFWFPLAERVAGIEREYGDLPPQETR